MTDHPQNTDAALKSTVQQSLTAQGWIALDSVAIATKSYATAVGPKKAYVYLALWGCEWVLTADYDSQGHNILESLRVTLPDTSDAEEIRHLTTRFSDGIDAKVAESYAVRLTRNQPQKQPFQLGTTVVTPGVLALLEDTLIDAGQLLLRHVADWTDEDRVLLETARAEGGRLMSVYQVSGQDTVTVWVITEADHSVTTILLPDEY
ncbi:hypothetical protein A1507_17605 [Methylomonas koyamae]|uniref:Uncharacterized protein n=1 Tax=Methylomonas koyamae TaxID=702114 RepID=A0A177N5Q7_9GAMM|nr:hypothetical protein [Methylomonas koyamae]OAI13185.1 hypothetical protein A1507_17605 [Methylomonas koyamae]